MTATASVPDRSELPLDRVVELLRSSGHAVRDARSSLISGGRSNLTYDLTVRTDDGEHRWILRRPPLGHVLATAHDMQREARVISALRETAVPVPGVVLTCADDDVIGAPFYVMERVEGDVLDTSASVLGLGSSGRSVGFALVDVLAALHAVDPAAVGLTDFGRPDGFLARQIRRWTRQLDASRSRDLPGLDRLGSALAADLPPGQPGTVVHGDYRLDNTLVRAGGVVAVLDWEMATLGDPLADVALFAVYNGGFAGRSEPFVHSPAGIGAFPSTEELLKRYAEVSGRDLRPLPWYLAFAWFKLAVILEGIHYRGVIGMSAGAEAEGAADAAVHATESGLAALAAGPVPPTAAEWREAILSTVGDGAGECS